MRIHERFTPRNLVVLIEMVFHILVALHHFYINDEQASLLTLQLSSHPKLPPLIVGRFSVQVRYELISYFLALPPKH